MDAALAGTVADAGITQNELRLAARNHALPLEALRHDITPPGLHYLLTHYDIPAVDPETFQLEIGGAVERPITFTLDALKERERVAQPIGHRGQVGEARDARNVRRLGYGVASGERQGRAGGDRLGRGQPSLRLLAVIEGGFDSRSGHSAEVNPQAVPPAHFRRAL